MPENADAERIFNIVQDQLIFAGMGGPVSINQMAIHAAMDLYGIADKQICFEKVLLVSRAVIKEQSERYRDK